MNYKKPNYETPDMRVFEMHIEGVMCLSDPGEQVIYSDPGEAGPDGGVIIGDIY